MKNLKLIELMNLNNINLFKWNELSIEHELRCINIVNQQ